MFNLIAYFLGACRCFRIDCASFLLLFPNLLSGLHISIVILPADLWLQNSNHNIPFLPRPLNNPMGQTPTPRAQVIQSA
jgi:hypothetical protein